ncbi:heme-binding-like protein [Hibiscus syriacus]|uniref:Heme-binding-like protein n=1 Tax=Hibiscus syriacus TaxID=106335 RepID=A0A6A2Y0R8_HIBSY|nr:heme-binding-like protein [Hibiscus syriacus]
MYKKPIKLIGGKVRKFASFSTYFSFSMSHGNGDGLAFILVPSTFKVDVLGNNAKHGDLNENHVGIDVGSLASVKAINLSSLNLVLNNGGKLHCWIDYGATSKRLEIRLNQSSSSRPADPLLSYSIDLSKLWNNEEVFVGLSSSNGKSSQTCFIHLWSFKLRQVPNWMHSQPLDPVAIAENPKPLTAAPKNNKCFWKVLVVFIFGGACGALTSSFVLSYRTSSVIGALLCLKTVLLFLWIPNSRRSN